MYRITKLYIEQNQKWIKTSALLTYIQDSQFTSKYGLGFKPEYCKANQTMNMVCIACGKEGHLKKQCHSQIKAEQMNLRFIIRHKT